MPTQEESGLRAAARAKGALTQALWNNAGTNPPHLVLRHPQVAVRFNAAHGSGVTSRP
jgi:hypothetical protein